MKRTFREDTNRGGGNVIAEAKIGTIDQAGLNFAKNTDNLPGAVTKEVFGDGYRLGCNNGLCSFDNNCIVENTLVKTNNGYKAANTISEGDELITYDEAKKKNVANKVLSVIKSKASKLVKLFVKGEALTLTNYHPVYALAKGASYWKYIAADSITKGMLLLSLNGSTAIVDSTSKLDSLATVINYELANNHNFAIGNNAIIIHNACFYNPEYSNINAYANFIDNTNNPSALFNKFTQYFNNDPVLLGRFNRGFINGGFNIKAWEMVHTFTGAGTISKLAKDEKILYQLSVMIQEGSAFRLKFPDTWELELNKIIATNKRLPCTSCGGAGYLYKSNLDDLFKEVDYLVQNFDVITTNGKGANKLWNWVRGLKQDGTALGTPGSAVADNPFLLPIMDELAQTLTYIKKTGLKESDITKFGAKIGESTKFTDIVKTINGIKYYEELKSLTLLADGLDDGLDVLKVSGINNPLLSHPQFGLQFIDGYMATIEDLAQLKYIFEARKLGANAETIAKAYFKDFIKVNKAEIWSKMNNELKVKLFTPSNGGSPDFSLFTTSKIDEIVNMIVKTY